MRHFSRTLVPAFIALLMTAELSGQEHHHHGLTAGPKNVTIEPGPFRVTKRTADLMILERELPIRHEVEYVPLPSELLAHPFGSQDGNLIKNYTYRIIIQIVFLGFPASQFDSQTLKAIVDEVQGDFTYDDDLNVTNPDVLAPALIDAGLNPALAETLKVRGGTINETTTTITKSPDAVFIGDEDDICNAIVLQGTVTVDFLSIDTITFTVGVLSPFHFAQYGDGDPGLFSQVLLFPLGEEASTATLTLRGDEGEDLETDLNGEPVLGPLAVNLPAQGLTRLRSDGVGPVAVGSGTVVPQAFTGGVILFGGPVGLAGVGISPPLDAFVAPIETGLDLNTGVALVNAGAEAFDVSLELGDDNGNLLATAREPLPGRGHFARFVNEFDWDPAIDFTNFQGLLKARAPQDVAATVIQTRTGEFATLPVALLPDEAIPAQGVKEQGEEADTFRILFAHFGEGLDLLFSQILLLNPDADTAVTGTLHLNNDEGNPLTVDLNGEDVEGILDFEVPAGGMKVFQTDGAGPLAVGSATVTSDGPLSGVILFGGAVGVAGIGESLGLRLGLIAPVESNTAAEINTGIAVQNVSPVEATLDLTLRDATGGQVATAQVEMAAGGHWARFLPEIEWDVAPDLSDFEGILEVDSGGAEIAASVLQTRPGQFATMPVAPSFR